MAQAAWYRLNGIINHELFELKTATAPHTNWLCKPTSPRKMAYLASSGPFASTAIGLGAAAAATTTVVSSPA